MKELDWANLPFGYMKTDYNVRIYYRNEQWGELEVCSEETIPMHMAATCLHYGQEAFEGLKAFRGKDGKVRIFRLEENAARLQSTCRGILMPELSTERFKEAILKVVKLNERFIPPYESGASLYIRPLLVGTGAQVGVHPASEYLFVVFVTPALTFIGSIDPFLAETKSYVEALRAAGVPVEFRIFEGGFHSFDIYYFANIAKEANKFIRDGFKYAAEHFSAPQPEDK